MFIVTEVIMLNVFKDMVPLLSNIVKWFNFSLVV